MNPITNSVAILWQRLGPYHHARLAGASRVLNSQGWSAIGIEVAGRDHYAWEDTAGLKRTLFPSHQYEQVPAKKIKLAVQSCLDELQPAAVAVNGWSVPEALAATAWGRRNGRQVILMSETQQSSGQFWKEWIKRQRVNRCAAALVGGRWHADYLASLGFPRDRIVTGYDAVDNEHFWVGAEKARSQESGVRSQYGLPDRYFYANTRFLTRKNIDGLLRAYAKYRRLCEAAEGPSLAGSSTNELGDRESRDVVVRSVNQRLFAERESTMTPWELVITGSGEMEADWKRFAKSLQVDEYVQWPGFTQYADLPVYYGLASTFIHVAHSEAWGLVVNEAAAAGLPLIVGTRVGAACELLQDGQNGFAVDSNEVDQIATAMLRTANATDSELNAMGRHSRELVARFSPECFGDALWQALCLARNESRANFLATRRSPFAASP